MVDIAHLVESLDSVDYKQYVIAFTCVIFGFEQYLNYRQYRRYLMRDRPKELADIVTEEDFKKAQSYNLDKSQFGFVHDLIKQLESVAILHYDGMAWLWYTSGYLLETYGGYGSEYQILQSLVFSILFSWFSTLTSLPFSLYSTFVVEEKHGFNKQTIGIFVSDLFKNQLVMLVLMCPLLSACLWVMQSTGDNFFLYIWILLMVFQLFIIMIYPTVIQPLFNKLTPMEEGDLRSQIEALAARIAFPLKKLYVIDGSKRSGHSNAYFYGFGKNKHIVLYDTLIDHSDNDEICAVLAHELGHWKMGHTLKLLGVTQLYAVTMFWFFSFFIHNVKFYQDFGFHTTPALIGFVLFQCVYAPVDSAISFLMHVYQRKNEYEADAFALKLGYASKLRSALIKLSIKNLGGFNMDPWYSAWNNSHPTLTERLNKLGVKPTSDKPIAVPEEESKKEL
ncbi:peptidase family M48-domain-containing protein [Absidia repens]|uniref:CAAX prenyl protease n=1 Tax=Absidia repens TaxID=90262 RepID=A0A1X2J2Y7_9FUNG|nr:peptidase family M48-domain-containing protein [Absidia repens]